MKKRFLFLLFAICTLFYAATKITFFFSLGVPTVEDVYGGRINTINGYKFHADSTRIFIATQSANSVFYADVLSNSATPKIEKFKVVPSLDNTQNFGSTIQNIQIHELSESIYFTNSNNELFSTNITSSTANNSGVSGVNQVIIKGNYIFAAGSGQIHFGTLNATNNFTAGAGSSITFPSFTDLYSIIIHPSNNKMYIFGKGTTPKLYISSDTYNTFSGSTTFTDISPTLSSTSVNWTGFGIAPDGRFFIGGNNNTNKYIAYSDDNGTSYSEFDTTVGGTSSNNFNFSGTSSSYHVLFASMYSNNKGISGSWKNFGNLNHYTHANDGAVFVDPNNFNIYYSTSDQGLGISYNRGQNVSSADDGIEAVQVNDMEMTSDKKTGWIASKSGIRKVTSYDTSPVWTNAMFPNGDGSSYFSIAMKPSDDATVYAGNVRIYKTTNSGVNWTKVFTPENSPYNYPNVGTQIKALTICPFDENIVFAGIEIQGTDKGGLFVSEDAGNSWSQILLHANSGVNDVDVRDISFTNESGTNTAYVGVDYTGAGSGYSIYKVEQSSSGWNVSQDMSASGTSTGSVIVVSINDLDYDHNTNTVYATGTDAGTNHPVSYYKPLGGTNLWSVNTSSGFPTSTANNIKQGKAIVNDGVNTLYCAVDNEIYYLTGSASSWTLGYSYPVGTEINCLFYDELLVGTGTGLYAQADPSNTASINDISNHIFTTYPNPVKNEDYLNIKFSNIVVNPTFRITTLEGKNIKEYKKNDVINLNKLSKIKIDNISSGIYLLSIYNKKKKLAAKKIIIN
ncbi:MAG: T9SS type A sorting domain-containing protein [Flavobacteriaceae bacterium]